MNSEWVDKYATSMHNGFHKMVPASWGPVDTFAVLAALDGAFIDKVHEAVVKLKDKPIHELKESFSNPSTLRGAILFLAAEYQGCKTKDKDKFKEVIEFLVTILQHMNKKDYFVLSSNVCHSKEDINEWVAEIPWNEGTPQDARELGKLYNSCAALSYALYRDFYPQILLEVYGPYSVSDNLTLLLKQATETCPVQLWPDFAFSYKDIKIYQVYEDVQFSCEIIGMHSLYEGDIINGLRKYAVEVDGKFINIEEVKKLAEEIAIIATKQALRYEDMNQEEVVQKTLEWNCYQFYVFFILAGMDWIPTKEMLDAVKGKSFPERAEFPSFPDLKTYSESSDFEVYWLRELYR
ncbi:MAG: hypothetical protein ACE5FT_07280 [Candidatus Nanoarchaeia archaeon]